MSFLSLILGFLSGAANSFSKVLEILKMKKFIEQGRKQKEAEIAAKENELNRQQTEILVQERTKKEVIDKMKDGTF